MITFIVASSAIIVINGVLALRRLPIDVAQVKAAFQNRKLPSIPDCITLHAEYRHTKTTREACIYC